MKSNIIVYTTTMCPVCRMQREFLQAMNVIYKEVNLDFHPLKRLELIARTKRLSVPQTNIAGNWVFGFDPVKMLEQLQDLTKNEQAEEL